MELYWSNGGVIVQDLKQPDESQSPDPRLCGEVSILGLTLDSRQKVEVVGQDSMQEGRMAAPDLGQEGRMSAPDLGQEGRMAAPDLGQEDRMTAPDLGQEGRWRYQT